MSVGEARTVRVLDLRKCLVQIALNCKKRGGVRMFPPLERQSRMARKPQASLCQATWPVGCERTSLLDGYNNTCKALEISDIIRGIRGKRDSNRAGREV